MGGPLNFVCVSKLAMASTENGKFYPAVYGFLVDSGLRKVANLFKTVTGVKVMKQDVNMTSINDNTCAAAAVSCSQAKLIAWSRP